MDAMKHWNLLSMMALSLMVGAAPVLAGPEKESHAEKKAEHAAAKTKQGAQQAAAQTEKVLGNAVLTARVKSALIADKVVPARSINVNSNKGVVTLIGHVETAQQKSRALQIAKKTVGVKKVVDKLSVEKAVKASTKH